MCNLDQAGTNALVLGIVRAVTGQPGVGLSTEFFANLGMLRPARRIFFAPIVGGVSARGCQLVGFTPDSCMAAITVGDLADIVFGSLANSTLGVTAFGPTVAAAAVPAAAKRGAKKTRGVRRGR